MLVFLAIPRPTNTNENHSHLLALAVVLVGWRSSLLVDCERTNLVHALVIIPIDTPRMGKIPSGRALAQVEGASRSVGARAIGDCAWRLGVGGPRGPHMGIARAAPRTAVHTSSEIWKVLESTSYSAADKIG